MKYLFPLICGFRMYMEGYEGYRHFPFVLIALRIIGCKCKLTNFNQYNLRVYI
jgi:hypothetical protein